MMVTFSYFIVLLVCSFSGFMFGQEVCLKCSDVPSPLDCDIVQFCGSHEVCYTEQYLDAHGFDRYNLGCRDTIQCGPAIVGRREVNSIANLTTSHNEKHRRSSGVAILCDECCSGKLCNSAGCGTTGIASNTSRGPVCFHCDQQHDMARGCDTIKTCGRAEMCKLSLKSTHIVHGYVYETSCESKKVCETILSHHSAGRKRYNHHIENGGVCRVQCCDSDLCNVGCGATSSTGSSGRPRECADIKAQQSSATDGVYTLYPYNTATPTVRAYCQFDKNGNWTIFQRRYNGSVDFYRNWTSYKEGFGSANGEYWLGNDIIHELTSYASHVLRIEMSDFAGVTKYAEYGVFKLSDEQTGYTLTADSYSGDAGNALSFCTGAGTATGSKFSTMDVDNDNYITSCATDFKGAWWYDHCHCSNLNGKYLFGQHNSYADGIEWMQFHGLYYSLKTVKMMLKKY